MDSLPNQKITELLSIQCHAQQSRYECNRNSLHFDKNVCITLKWWLNENYMKVLQYASNIHVSTHPILIEHIYWPQCKTGTHHVSGNGGGGALKGKCPLERFDAENFSQSYPTCFEGNDFRKVYCNISKSLSFERLSTIIWSHVKGFWTIFLKTNVHFIH